jgi:hypothetical protein
MFIYVCMALDVVVDKVLAMSDIHAWRHGMMVKWAESIARRDRMCRAAGRLGVIS